MIPDRKDHRGLRDPLDWMVPMALTELLDRKDQKVTREIPEIPGRKDLPGPMALMERLDHRDPRDRQDRREQMAR